MVGRKILLTKSIQSSEQSMRICCGVQLPSFCSILFAGPVGLALPEACIKRRSRCSNLFVSDKNMNFNLSTKNLLAAALLSLVFLLLPLSSCSKKKGNDDTTLMVLLWMVLSQPSYPVLTSVSTRSDGEEFSSRLISFNADNTIRTTVYTDATDGTKNYTKTDEFDSDGNLTRSVQDFTDSTSNDQLVVYSDYIDVSDGDPLATTESHYSGTTTADSNSLYCTITRTFDFNANRVSSEIKQFSDNYKYGSYGDKYTFAYNSFGDLSTKIYYYHLNKNDEWTKRYEISYQYDSSQRLQHKVTNYGESSASSGSHGYRTDYTYSSDSTTVTETSYRGSWDVEAADSNLYDSITVVLEKGKIKSFVSKDSANVVLFTVTYDYSADNQTVTATTDFTETGLNQNIIPVVLGKTISTSSGDTTGVRALDESGEVKTIKTSFYKGKTATGTPSSEILQSYSWTSDINYNGWTPTKEDYQHDVQGFYAFQTYENAFFIRGKISR